MALKDIKKIVKLILNQSFYWLQNVDIKKGDSLRYTLKINNLGIESLKPILEHTFGVKIKKKELRDCLDVEDLIDDKLWYYSVSSALPPPPPPTVDPLSFFFCMAAKIAKADGVVTQEEMNFIVNCMNSYFKMDATQRSEIMKHWTEAKSNTQTFEYYTDQFYPNYKDNQGALSEALHILFGLAAADKKLHPSEEKMLKYAAAKFGLSSSFENFKQQYFPGIEKYYEILKCKKEDSDEFIKQAYRKIAGEIHPDKLTAKELPAEMMEFAKKRFQDIQEAYEMIKKERGMR